MNESVLRGKMAESGVPEHLRKSLINYTIHRVKPGNFLQAVLANDLANAVRRGDDKSRNGLVNLMCFLDRAVEPRCWGSDRRISDWVSGRTE